MNPIAAGGLLAFFVVISVSFSEAGPVILNSIVGKIKESQLIAEGQKPTRLRGSRIRGLRNLMIL
jgi:hypothetical protein